MTHARLIYKLKTNNKKTECKAKYIINALKNKHTQSILDYKLASVISISCEMQ
jgi:hypothetical protein